MKFIITDDRGGTHRVETMHIDQARSWAGRNGFVVVDIHQVDRPGRWDTFEKIEAVATNPDEWRMGL